MSKCAITPKNFAAILPHLIPLPLGEEARTPRLGKGWMRDRSLERDDLPTGAETDSLSQRERVRVRENST